MSTVKYYDVKWCKDYTITRDDQRTIKLESDDGHKQIFSTEFFKQLIKDKQLIKI